MKQYKPCKPGSALLFKLQQTSVTFKSLELFHITCNSYIKYLKIEQEFSFSIALVRSMDHIPG